MKKAFQIILQPYIIFVLMSVLSFVCWALPNFNGYLRKGFDVPFNPSLKGVTTSILWLALVFSTSLGGFLIGKAIKLDTSFLDRKSSLNDSFPLKIMLILAFVGVAYVYLRILTSLGVSGSIAAITGGQANELKYALYENYAPGLPSLRYLAIPAAALGAYHFLKRRYIHLSIISFLLLVSVAIVSSRLSIIYTVFILLGLIARDKQINFKGWQMVLGFVVLVHVIFALNYSRNINFYRAMGVDNFYLAGISEVVAYVGSPFQGFLAVSEDPKLLSNMAEVDTHRYIDISHELTTNSAFLELVREGDIYSALVRIVWSTGLSSFLMAVAWRNNKNILILIFGALGYCFAEIWRINLFGQGIVTTIVIGIVLVALVCILWSDMRLIRQPRS